MRDGRAFIKTANECEQKDKRIAALEAELDGRDWSVLMRLLDKHWPSSVFPTTHEREEPERDPGPRIVALIRWVDELKAEHDEETDEFNAGWEAAKCGVPEVAEPTDTKHDVWTHGWRMFTFDTLEQSIAKAMAANRELMVANESMVTRINKLEAELDALEGQCAYCNAGMVTKCSDCGEEPPE